MLIDKKINEPKLEGENIFSTQAGDQTMNVKTSRKYRIRKKVFKKKGLSSIWY